MRWRKKYRDGHVRCLFDRVSDSDGRIESKVPLLNKLVNLIDVPASKKYFNKQEEL